MNQRYWSSRIQGLVPYTPGEQPKDRTFIKLNTNENPYPPSPRVLEAIRREADPRLRLYPDPESAALRGALAEHYGVEPEQVFCGNGSDEVLGLCFYALFSPGRKVVFPDITYSFYPVYTQLFGLDYEEIPLNEDFTLPVERFLGGNGGAVICNPNAPTGRALPLLDIQRIVEANQEAAVLVDEAYADFGAQSAVELIGRYPNLLVVRTMSKSRSLAGMRIGYALGSPDLIADLNRVKYSFHPYNVNRLSMAAGAAAVADEAYFAACTAAIRQTRAWTVGELENLGFTVLPSQANFVFAKHQQLPGETLYRKLKENGVLVRWFDADRIRDYVRITIGSMEQMETLVEELTALLEWL